MSSRSNAGDKLPPHSHNADNTAASVSNGNISDNEETSSALMLDDGDGEVDGCDSVDEKVTNGERFMLTYQYFLFSENKFLS